MKRTMATAGLLAAGLVLGAEAAHASYSVTVEKRTLVLTGDRASDKLGLLVRKGRLAIDVRDDGRAEARVLRRRFDRIRVRAGAGDDTVRVLSTSGTPTTLDGGPGDDTLFGGPGRDLLIGGRGRDVADGNRGKDSARLGAGNDRFAWQPGDGSDAVDGEAGVDALAFAGSGAAEAFRVAPAGSRARLTRDVGGIVTGLDAVERIDVAARGGADTLTVDDQSATAVRAVTGDLGATDGASDHLIVNGTAGGDALQASDATVTGLVTAVTVAGRERLTVNGLAGDDSIAAAGLTTAFTADGGDGADTVAGGPAADTLLGGAGGDRLVWNPGDGGDTLNGQADQDVLAVTGSEAGDLFAAAADDGGRVRLTRTAGNVTLSLDDTERLDLAMRGGADELIVNDLSATDLTAVNAALGADTMPDSVVVNGTGGDDTITASGGAAGITAAANGRGVAVSGAEPLLDRLSVNALGGSDTVSTSGLANGAIGFTGDGGAGNDDLAGGPAQETFVGGDGIDRIVPGPANDFVVMGGDTDFYRWQSGDGSDSVDGEGGRDVMIARGGPGGERFVIGPVGAGPDASIIEDLSGQAAILRSVEEVDLEPLGGNDFVIFEDMSATPLQLLQVGFGSDGSGDVISARGSAGADTVTVGPVGGLPGLARVQGLPGNRGIEISGAQPADDVLEVQGRGGDNRVDASGLPADTIDLHFVGGDGNDVMLGGAGADFMAGNGGADRLDGADGEDSLHGDAGDDEMSGGPGNDAMTGGPGNDDMFGGPGNDFLRGDEGDDNLFGEFGDDDLDGGPGNDTEID